MAAIDTSRPKTAADYAAIAVAPLLIFLMISSLANFLMLVLYHGSHPGRVAWILLMFTMGAVGIARIAIEKDRSYSLGYAAVLGIAAFITITKFLDSPIFCIFILALVGYLADRIVRDCTLIDDSVDASGQGLIDSGRLFVKQQLTTSIDDDQSASAGDSLGDPVDPIKPTRGNKRNQPGRTVMYLSFAALPLFGCGQLFLRSDDATWRRAQFLLAIYLFASLSLLVTTSFLGLRRYLRQRKVDMPTNVSVAWLAGGMAMIAAILMVSYVAPMPGQALASFELPNVLDSPDGLKASRYGWGDEAADESDPEASSTRNDPNADDKELQSVAAEKGAEAGDVGDGERDDGPAGKQKGGKKPAAGDGPKKGPSDSESKSQPPSGGKSEPEQSGSKQNSDDSSSGDESSEQSGDDSQSADSESSQSQESDPGDSDQNSGADQDSSERQSESDSSEANEPDPSSRSDAGSQSDSQQQSDSGVSGAISNVIPMLSGLMRLVVFLVLVTIVATFAWRNREAISQWWHSLWKPKQRPETDPSFAEFLQAETRVPPRGFATYRNPLGVEKDARRIVVITFQAFEAWSREQGSTRGKDETPSEFVRRISPTLPHLSASASQLVDSYNRIVYGRGQASKLDVDVAKKIWHTMQAS